jgi:hypothetical protein
MRPGATDACAPGLANRPATGDNHATQGVSMPLAGTFDSLPLMDLVQLLHQARMSGSLTLTCQEEETRLGLREGVLVSLTVDDPIRADIRPALLAGGYLTEEELQRTLELAVHGAPLRAALGNLGLLSPEAIARAQAEHAFETAVDLLFQTEGSFHFARTGGGFRDSEPLPDQELVGEPIDGRALLFEAARRRDEWTRIRGILPHSRVLVQATSCRDPEERDGDPPHSVLRELEKLCWPISVGKLCLRMGGSRFRIHQQLFEACRRGLVRVDPTASSGMAAVEQLVGRGAQLLEDGRPEEALEPLATAVGLEPDHPRGRALHRQARQALLDSLYRVLPPEAVPELSGPRVRLAHARLDPREVHLAVRLDGRSSVARLVSSAAYGELETLRLLHRLLRSGFLRLRPAPA